MSGTCRGFSRGKIRCGGTHRKDGNDWTVMNNIWEKVSAEPVVQYVSVPIPIPFYSIGTHLSEGSSSVVVHMPIRF